MPIFPPLLLSFINIFLQRFFLKKRKRKKVEQKVKDQTDFQPVKEIIPPPLTSPSSFYFHDLENLMMKNTVRNINGVENCYLPEGASFVADVIKFPINEKCD